MKLNGVNMNHWNWIKFIKAKATLFAVGILIGIIFTLIYLKVGFSKLLDLPDVEIIAYIGGWVTLTVGVAVYIGQFFAERMADKLKLKWSGEQEQKLEKLREEITRKQSIFTAILNSYSSSHQFSQTDRIKAVQTLWESTLETRKLGFTPSFIDATFFESEYNTLIDKGELKSLSIDNTIGKIPPIVESVEKSRPFLGEHLWSLFKIYTILVGRVSWLFIDGRNKKNLKSWHKDEYIQSFLNEIFDEKEIDFIKSKILGSFKAATELLEQKILFEMFKIISGELAAESDLSKAKKLQKLIEQKETELTK